MSDLKTARIGANRLRIPIAFLAAETEAERINIVGCSTGTRMGIDALDELALIHSHADKADLARNLRIGQVILAGSGSEASAEAKWPERPSSGSNPAAPLEPCRRHPVYCNLL